MVITALEKTAKAYLGTFSAEDQTQNLLLPRKKISDSVNAYHLISMGQRSLVAIDEEGLDRIFDMALNEALLSLLEL